MLRALAAQLGERGLVVGDHHRLPQVDALELVAVVHFDAGAANQVLERQVAAPAELRAQGAEPFFHHADEAVGRLIK